mmetsp:Transcript_14501/g.35431  ORF Transcript_14501/g.35431 Transcript_14501/m.35431 type:complete len:433 (+) Transcript_14501:146-1444(+)
MRAPGAAALPLSPPPSPTFSSPPSPSPPVPSPPSSPSSSSSSSLLLLRTGGGGEPLEALGDRRLPEKECALDDDSARIAITTSGPLVRGDAAGDASGSCARVGDAPLRFIALPVSDLAPLFRSLAIFARSSCSSCSRRSRRASSPRLTRSFFNFSSRTRATSLSRRTRGFSTSQSCPTCSSIHRMPRSTCVSGGSSAPPRSAVHVTMWCRAFCRVVSPSPSAIAAADLAPGRSCLLAKTTMGFPLRCGSRRVSANTSRHSCSRSSAAESTTKIHPCTSAVYAFQMPRIRLPPPRSKRSTSNPPRVVDALVNPKVGIVFSGAPPRMVCSSVDLPAPSRPTSTNLRFLVFPLFFFAFPPRRPPPLCSPPPSPRHPPKHPMSRAAGEAAGVAAAAAAGGLTAAGADGRHGSSRCRFVVAFSVPRLLGPPKSASCG